MGILNLPGDIFPGMVFEKDEIIMYDYSALKGSFKERSMMHQNAISLVKEGEKTIHFAEKKVEIKPDEFHFLSSGNCLASMDLSRQQVFKSILIFFDDMVLQDFYIKNNAQIQEIKSKHTICQEPYIYLKKDEFVYNYIHSLELILGSGQPVSKAMKRLKFEELMLYLLEKYPLQLLSFQIGKKSTFDDLELRKIMENNITNQLTLEELAFLCNMSLSTFKRRFAQIYQTSPNSWLLHKRMQIAANLLGSHLEKPSEVYYKLGYENHSSFTKSFRKIYGVSPKEYQNQIMNA